MFMAGSFIAAIARLVDLVLNAYMWIIIIRAVLSWVNPDPFNPIVRFLYQVTEPVLRPIRRRLPTFQLGLDLSPMVVVAAIYYLRPYVVSVLYRIAYEFG